MTKNIRYALCLSLLAACAPTPSAPPAEPVFIPIPPPVEGKAKPLIEYSGAELIETFGPPSAVRSEGVGELWRYDVGACRIFFFFDAGAPVPKMRLYESLPPGHPGSMDRNCFSAFELRIKKKTG